MITARFFMENKDKIGVTPIPDDLMGQFKMYMVHKEKTSSGTPQKKIFWGQVVYFTKLKYYGMTPDEKKVGERGLEILKKKYRVFYH